MTENTTKGRELYYLIKEIIKDSLWRNEYSDHSKEEFEERFNDHYSELSEELYEGLVKKLHSDRLADRSTFIVEVVND